MYTQNPNPIQKEIQKRKYPKIVSPRMSQFLCPSIISVCFLVITDTIHSKKEAKQQGRKKLLMAYNCKLFNLINHFKNYDDLSHLNRASSIKDQTLHHNQTVPHHAKYIQRNYLQRGFNQQLTVIMPTRLNNVNNNICKYMPLFFWRNNLLKKNIQQENDSK